MKKISVLDCTLRDGGYCNEWLFGKENTVKIINGLTNAGVEIIECGFLTNKVEYNQDATKFTNTHQIAQMLPTNHNGQMYVCMINYGEYDLDDIPKYDGTGLDGLRVAFHKKDVISALELCKGIKEKGYKVFIQAMVSLNYSDEEFLDLIHRVNAFEPYAFYIVDSFGVMNRKNLMRLFDMVDQNLKNTIKIGYHSHNNMQLSYSNAQKLVDVKTNRKLIIDSSVFGMGRGAGNLNTELFVEYLNENFDSQYQLKPLLTIIDEILNSFYQQNYWGYSLPNYLSAKHNLHPNYASYLDAKKTLTVENIDEIFTMMDSDKRSNYDKNYIEDLYMRYMATGNVQESHLTQLKETVYGKEILIIAPGRSSVEEKDKIIKVANRNNVVSISINFDYSEYDTDFIFISNLRRFRGLLTEKYSKCIVTSNIPAIDVYLQTNYQELLNSCDYVKDNAGMMLIKFLINLGASKILIAGMDGYSFDATQNFANKKMNFFAQKDTFEAMNRGINEALKEYSQYVDIKFVTTPKFVKI